jgi:hypothetical protein
MKAGEMRRIMSQHANPSIATLTVNIKAKSVYGGIRHNSMLSRRADRKTPVSTNDI